MGRPYDRLAREWITKWTIRGLQQEMWLYMNNFVNTITSQSRDSRTVELNPTEISEDIEPKTVTPFNFETQLVDNIESWIATASYFGRDCSSVVVQLGIGKYIVGIDFQCFCVQLVRRIVLSRPTHNASIYFKYLHHKWKPRVHPHSFQMVFTTGHIPHFIILNSIY